MESPSAERARRDLAHAETVPDASRNELRLIRRSILERWPVDAEQRRLCVERAMRIIADVNALDVRALSAIRTVVLMDSVNAKREATDASVARAEVSAATEALRLALSKPGMREALAALSDRVAAPPAPPDAGPTGDAPTGDARASSEGDGDGPGAGDTPRPLLPGGGG